MSENQPPSRPIPINTTAGNARSTQSSSTTNSAPPATPHHHRTPSTPTTIPRSDHRNSLAGLGDLRSPRSQRTSSVSSQPAVVQELLKNPPTVRGGEGSTDDGDRFRGRDWRAIRVGEVTEQELVRFVEVGTSVEDATNLLISSGSPNVILLRENANSQTAIGTFDYSDLNAYLLLVVGLAQPDSEHIASFREMAQKAREGKPIPLREVKDLSREEPLITLPHSAPLAKAVEIFAAGVHRIIIVKEESTDVVGVLTQLRLIQFFWDNGRWFSSIEGLLVKTLYDLQVGTREVRSISGDAILTDALELMDREGITSLPVLDNASNVIGNISHVDVRLLTTNTALPLLRSTCIHFISVILSERGVNDGKDSYPVFHVSPYSTLAHTVAKLVATRSHRMWIVDSPSPSASTPSTPLLSALSNSTSSIPPPPSTPGAIHPTAATLAALPSPHQPLSSTSTPVPASAMPSTSLSGRLTGVISLTDILNLFARASGLVVQETTEMRRHRRRSSSGSMRRSVDSGRSESVGGLSGEVSRKGSLTGGRRVGG